MNELIKVEGRMIGGGQAQTISARELHAFLEVGKDFSSWIKNRIKQYGFHQGEDYEVSPHSGENSRVFARTGENLREGRRAIEYAITLDMAKELSMVERNERGKQARRYFIECERRLLAKPVGKALSAPRDELPAAFRSAINRRAYALSHAAYEEYRKRMADDIMIKGGHQHPKNWKPLETRQEVMEHVEVIAGTLEAYVHAIRERGRRFGQLVGEDYDLAVERLLSPTQRK